MNSEKRIIQRNLPLNQKYILLSTCYVPLIDGIGLCCDNCGKPIANIATVKGATTGKTHSIGFDCMETFLINNVLLDRGDVERYETVVKKSLGLIKKIREQMKDFLAANNWIDTVTVKVDINGYSNWVITEYFYKGVQKWNDCQKIKVMDSDMLLASLNTIKTNAKFILI